jgi:hypothetical protein
MAACEGGHFFVTFPSNGGVDAAGGRGGFYFRSVE